MSRNQASERTQLRVTMCFFFHYYLATSTTNWAQIFTGLVFYAYVKIHQVCPGSLKLLDCEFLSRIGLSAWTLFTPEWVSAMSNKRDVDIFTLAFVQLHLYWSISPDVIIRKTLNAPYWWAISLCVYSMLCVMQWSAHFRRHVNLTCPPTWWAWHQSPCVTCAQGVNMQMFNVSKNVQVLTPFLQSQF